jgi:hypothetical protein
MCGPEFLTLLKSNQNSEPFLSDSPNDENSGDQEKSISSEDTQSEDQEAATTLPSDKEIGN